MYCLMDQSVLKTSQTRSVDQSKMLAERLKELEQEGIIERTVLPETPVKVIYSLTEKGNALHDVFHEVSRWAGEYTDSHGKKEQA